MNVDKLSVSFDADLGEAVRAAAALAHRPVSAWLAEAAAAKLRSEALAAYLDAWEVEHEAFTAAELAAAERDLGVTAHGAA